MNNKSTQPAAWAAVFSLTALLLWWGISKTQNNSASSRATSPQQRIGAAERLAGMRERALSAARLVREQASVRQANLDSEPIQGAFVLNHASSSTGEVSQKHWRAHAVRKAKPLAAELPKGTVMFRGQPAHPSRVMARVKLGTSNADLRSALDGIGAQIVNPPNALGWVAIDLPAAEGERAALDGEMQLMTGLKLLQGTDAFQSAEPDYVLTRAGEPTDEGYANGWLWGLRNTGQNGGRAGIDIGTAKAWEVTTGSTDVLVAVIDTGIRHTHQELRNQMWVNPDEIAGNGIDDDGDGYIDNVHGIDVINNDGDPMDDHGHGTHCAGTIGASANDGYAHVGVAWDVRLMGCKFLSAQGSGYTSGAVTCIDFAVSKGAKVLSNSWGGGGFSQSLYDAIQRAQDAGVLFIAAAGNSGLDTDNSPNYPSAYDLDNIIAVAAIDRSGNLASWSNFGKTTVDLGAPGVDIFSTVADSDDSYAYYSGTSMATPHVAGVMALLLAHDRSLSAAQAKARLLNTSVFLDSLRGRTVSGGLANAGNAVDGSDDGSLELTLAVSEDPLRGGRTAAVFASVTDVTPVTGATVTGDAGGDSLSFADDGVAPDVNANDGVYSATLDVPDDSAITELVITAEGSAPDKDPASASLTVAVVHPPANDDFEESADLSGRRASLSGFTNVAATAEDGEPRHYWLKAQKSVWFTWTAPRSGRGDITLRGSDFDTVMAVYRGNTLDGLRRVARDDDSGGRLTSRVRFNVRRGLTYHIAVDGWRGAEGNIEGRLIVKKRKPFRRTPKRPWWQWR
ncbi:MAG: S8 family serine peptidase [Verrucomicrobia subdivision 3 bacterium]|nr:S8 family serine peptidase [Limisphaerales bacterium]